MNDEQKTSLIIRVPYKVSSANADMNLRLRLGAFTDFLIQSAIASANTLHAGPDELRHQNLFWVLSRLTLEIYKPLKWCHSGEIETWPKNVEKIIYLRDFLVMDHEQEVIAKASSGWLAVDAKSKRPRLLPETLTELFCALKERHALDTLPEKLQALKDGEISELKTTYFDIDLNGHVTASRYVDWMMDSFSVTFHAENYPKFLSMNYINETLINEEIQLRKTTKDATTFLFEGYNKTRNVTAFFGKIIF